MISIKNFYSNLLKEDQRLCKDIEIYNIGYITIKKFGHCENIQSVNTLHLIIDSTTGHSKWKDDEKYLIIYSIENTKKFCLEIDQKLKHLMVEKNCFVKKDYAKIGINTDDDLPLNKPLKFSTLAIIIRCLFQESEKMYP